MWIVDDIFNAIAAANAARQQAEAAQKALDLQKEMYTQQRADQAPWLQAGQTGLADLMRLKDDPNAIQSSPAFQFRMQEGQKALERSAAARGGLMGGGFAKGLARYSQGVASDEYGNQWNRLSGLAQMGQNSTQNIGGLSSHYADAASNLYGAQGNANAAGQIAGWGGVANSIKSAGQLAMLGMGGGFSGMGIPGLGGGGGGQSTGYVANYIPRQQGYGG